MSEAALLELLLSDEHPAGVLVVEHGQVVRANAAATALLGPTVAGAEVASLVDEGSRRKLAAALASSERGRVEVHGIQTGRPIAIQLRVEPLGQRRLLVVVGAGPAYPIGSEALLLDTNARLVNLARELSVRGSELAAANARLEQLAALREEFTAALSHDIRGPLAAIQLTTALLQRTARTVAPDDIARYGESILRNVEHAVHMVEQILDAAHLDSGALQIAKVPVSLVAVARDVAESVRAIASRASVKIEVEPVETEPSRGWVLGEPVRLFSMVANLVGNAIRHSPPGGVVRVAVGEDGDLVRCEVRDQGPGVPHEMRASIFERFQRSGEHQGSVGLGLYIVQRLVELHGGRVWVEDAAPAGAAFIFELPRAVPPNPRA